jgi:hypothetical protein
MRFCLGRSSLFSGGSILKDRSFEEEEFAGTMLTAMIRYEAEDQLVNLSSCSNTEVATYF